MAGESASGQPDVLRRDQGFLAAPPPDGAGADAPGTLMLTFVVLVL
jgi:hypothetical protein